MPRYLLSVHGAAERTESGAYPSEEAMLAALADTGAFNERLHRDGHVIFAGSLEPATTATTVDWQGGKAALFDGPYLQTRECLGGFWVIEVADLDVALAVAAEGSKVCRGTVEVRPFRAEQPVRALPEP